MIELNQNAQIIEGFVAVVEIISACISENATSPTAEDSLARIRRRLNIGSSMPFAACQSAQQDKQSANFLVDQDLPGELSRNGPRHDNDHASITDIQILPTAEEMASFREDYLPSITSHGHQPSSLARLLDRQFRLLREDTVGQLRDGA